MLPTMKDIARMAGVSRSTVDRVLNGRGKVDTETKDRIIALASSMGYKPNIAAKSLAQRNKNLCIGCLILSEGNSFFDDVLAGVRQAAQELSVFGIKVEIVTAKGFDVDQQLELIDKILDGNVNALAITPINDSKVVDKLNSIIQSNIPVVSLTAEICGVDYFAYIGTDHLKAGRIAADICALISGGKAKVGIIEGSHKMLAHSHRVEGFTQVIGSKYPEISVAAVIENEDDDIISYKETYKLLLDHPEIDFLFFVAAGVSGGIRALIDLKLDRKIKVTVFDLTAGTRKYLSEGIISVILCQEPFLQGQMAIKVLCDYLLSDIAPETKKILTKTEVLVQESII